MIVVLKAFVCDIGLERGRCGCKVTTSGRLTYGVNVFTIVSCIVCLYCFRYISSIECINLNLCNLCATILFVVSDMQICM